MSSSQPTPSINRNLPFRPANFPTFRDAVDYAAQGETGMNFYSARGELVDRLSYHDARETALGNARRLLHLGLRAGDRVILLADTTREFIDGFLACLYAGLVPAPAAIPVVFGEHDDYVSGLRRRILACGARAAISPTGLKELLLEAAGDLNLVFCGSALEMAALPHANIALPTPVGSDLAYLQYSSGSTRDPAGIEISHDALIANASHIVAHGLMARAGDRCVSWLPFYHDMGFVGFLLVPLCAQLSVDLMPTREFARRPMTWLQIISRNRGTLSYSPSFGYELCTRQAARTNPADLDLSCWRAAGIGGDMVRPQILEDFATIFAPAGFSDKSFVPSYGMAEVTLAISFAPLGEGAKKLRMDRAELAAGYAKAAADDDRNARILVSCGTILPNHDAEIRDENGATIHDDRVGRIFLRGPSMMTGYFLKPEETAEILSSDGWLDTGDLGFFRNGEIVITGRAKDLILVNGRNVWPQDVEWQVETLDRLRRGDVCAFSIDEGAKTEQVVVLIQCRTGEAERRQVLTEGARAILRKLGIGEAHIHLIAPGALPQTSSGKLSRSAAKRKFLAGDYDTNPTEASSGSLHADEAV